MSETVLALLGFGMVLTFIVIVMAKWVSPQVALALIPVVFGLIAGEASEIGKMMMDGIRETAPTGVLLIFGILYFGIMMDVGLFDPVVAFILKLVKGDPLKVIVGTGVLSLFVALVGEGAITYMIVVSAMLPLYTRLGIRPIVLTVVAMMGAGIMHLLPWAGPSARVMIILNEDASQVFNPLIGSMIAGSVWVVMVSYYFGIKERRRLGVTHISELPENEKKTPKLIWVNLLLTLTLMVTLLVNLLPLVVLFIIALAIALLINYPKLSDQRTRLAAHAGNALAVSSMVFAAGIFTGILDGTNMLNAMGQSFIRFIPESWGSNMPVITALTSMPFTFSVSNDAYYFGIVPLAVEAGKHFGVPALEVGRASLMGQPFHLLSPLVPSTYLLVGMAGVNYADHQRAAFLWTVGTVLVMTAASLYLGTFHLHV
jgi:citrate-Mg2+:H+ or citrate-Ca2+:H+ symporter, CitMHS family